MMKNVLKVGGVLAAPYLVEIIVSFLVWIFALANFRQMISGFFQPMYILVGIATIGSLQYIWGSKMVHYVFWAGLIAVTILVFQQIIVNGLQEFFRQFYVLFFSWGTDALPAMKIIENTGFSYFFTFMIIYLVYHRGKIKAPLFQIEMILSIFFLSLCFKRSAINALVLGILVSFLFFRRKSRKGKKILSKVINITITIFALCYVPFVRYDYFSKIAESFQIETSGRNLIYEIYAQYYEISPSYTGRGLGWVYNRMSGLEGLEGANVHCDYVRSYIELGFWGYIIWVLIAFSWMFFKLVKCDDKHNDSTIVACLVAMVVLCMTENIHFFFLAQLGLSAVIMSSFFYNKSA